MNIEHICKLLLFESEVLRFSCPNSFYAIRKSSSEMKSIKLFIFFERNRLTHTHIKLMFSKQDIKKEFVGCVTEN